MKHSSVSDDVGQDEGTASVATDATQGNVNTEVFGKKRYVGSTKGKFGTYNATDDTNLSEQ